MTHFHVGENTPGYIPDSDPSICETLTDARMVARELAQSYRDDDDGAYRVTGNMRDGYTVEDRGRTHDLGRVIWISDPCTREDCATDGDQ